MLVIISDASTLIDIIHADLTATMFSLSYQFIVPDILFEDELSLRHSNLLDFGLISQSMDERLIAETASLREQYSKPSFYDLLALTLAKKEKCPLLTGDKSLRDVAKIKGVEVYGTIWLVEQMLKQQKVSVEIARLSFQRMKSVGSRLPWDKVENMLREYE